MSGSSGERAARRARYNTPATAAGTNATGNTKEKPQRRDQVAPLRTREPVVERAKYAVGERRQVGLRPPLKRRPSPPRADELLERAPKRTRGRRRVIQQPTDRVVDDAPRRLVVRRPANSGRSVTETASGNQMHQTRIIGRT